MELDRPLQLKILESLKDNYPNISKVAPLKAAYDNEFFLANLYYLIGHGLIEPIAEGPLDLHGKASEILQAKITVIGLDFLADDGGIGAILKTITVKFDPEDLYKLISIRLDNSNTPTDKKDTIMSTIKKLPATTLKTLYTKLINLGLDSVPDAYHLIETYLSNQIS